MSKLLEVGDTILKRHFGSISFVGKVDRVTNTTAFIGDSKYKRELGQTNKTVTSIPRSQYSSAWLFVADENDLSELRKQNLIYFVVNFDYKTLSFEKMVEIRDIIKRTE
jgi:hypothetical protein